MATARARSKAKTTPKEVRVGIIGSGAITKKATSSTLNEFFAGLGDANVTFVVPLTKALFTDGIKTVADHLMGQEVKYEIIGDPADIKTRALKPYATNAVGVHERQRGLLKRFVELLSDGDEAKLLVLLEDDDDALNQAMDMAFEADIPVLALNQGLDELEADTDADDAGDDDAKEDAEGDDAEDDDDDDADDDADTEADDEDGEEEAPVARKRRKAAAADNGFDPEALAKDVLRSMSKILATAAK